MTVHLIEEEYKRLTDKAIDFQFIAGRALIIHGDSSEIFSDTDGLKIDSVITDPPYDFESRGGPLYGREKSHFDSIRSADITNGFDHNILKSLAMVADHMLVFMHNDQALDLLKLLTDTQFFYEEHPSRMGQFMEETKPPLYDRYILGQWHKSNPMPVANKHYKPDTELYIHAWRRPAFPQGKLEDLGRFMIAPVGKSDFNHPTVKPLKLMKKAVVNASMPGDVVVDPFLGSGSTGVAALGLGRLFVGVELSRDFYDMACKRIRAACGHFDGPIHDKDVKQKSLFEEDMQND